MKAEGDNWEDWLREHPEANDDLADLSRLRELYQSVSPPEPDESAWGRMSSRLQESIGRSRWPRLRWAIAFGAAAAAMLAILLTRPLWTPPPSPPMQGEGEGRAPTETVQNIEEPFPVAEADDVIIVSMDARDVAALVVGEPPIGGDLEFARAEDIRVIRCERCPYSGRFARLDQGAEVPMFVSATVGPANNDRE